MVHSASRGSVKRLLEIQSFRNSNSGSSCYSRFQLLGRPNMRSRLGPFGISPGGNPVSQSRPLASSLHAGHFDHSLAEQKRDKQNHHRSARFWQPRCCVMSLCRHFSDSRLGSSETASSVPDGVSCSSIFFASEGSSADSISEFKICRASSGRFVAASVCASRRAIA